MELKIIKQIGRNKMEFLVSGKNLFEVTREANKLAFNDVKKCGCCSGNNLALRAFRTKENFEYTKIECLKCKSTLTFGKRKDDPDTFYLRRKENGELDWVPNKEHPEVRVEFPNVYNSSKEPEKFTPEQQEIMMGTAEEARRKYFRQ